MPRENPHGCAPEECGKGEEAAGRVVPVSFQESHDAALLWDTLADGAMAPADVERLLGVATETSEGRGHLRETRQAVIARGAEVDGGILSRPEEPTDRSAPSRRAGEAMRERMAQMTRDGEPAPDHRREHDPAAVLAEWDRRDTTSRPGPAESMRIAQRTRRGG